MKKKISFLYPGKSRFERLNCTLKGKSPKEFYYGYLNLKEEGFNVSIIDTHTDPKNIINKLLLKYE